jgi:hypothetical protein
LKFYNPLFPASNETQWNWIKKVINESDYYIVIVGGKYGTIPEETGLSYTEMEYKYALEKNIPVIGFLYEDINKLPSEKTEIDVDRRSKLNNFRELVKKKLCKFYNSPSDLGAKVSRSMTQLKKQFPAIGWIRANVVNDNNYSKEILRLRDENEALQKEEENFTDFLIRQESLNTILMQFRALKYITINRDGRWELTKYGDKYYTELVAIRKK